MTHTHDQRISNNILNGLTILNTTNIATHLLKHKSLIHNTYDSNFITINCKTEKLQEKIARACVLGRWSKTEVSTELLDNITQCIHLIVQSSCLH